MNEVEQMTKKASEVRIPVAVGLNKNAKSPNHKPPAAIPNYARCLSHSLNRKGGARKGRTGGEKRIDEIEDAVDGIKEAAVMIKGATLGTKWETEGLIIVKDLERLVNKTHDGNRVHDILSEMIDIEKIESDRNSKSSPKRRAAQTAITFVAELDDGTRPEIRFRNAKAGYIGELCVGGKHDMVLLSKHPISEQEAKLLANMVFEEEFGDSLMNVTRKANPVQKDGTKAAHRI